MQCHQTEKRLQELLDERRLMSADAVLGAHLRRCPQCRQLAARYDAMLAGTSALADAPPLAPAFSERTVARARASAAQRNQATPGGGQRRRIPPIAYWLAIAASLLLFAWPLSRRPHVPLRQVEPATSVENAAIGLASSVSDSLIGQRMEHSHQQLWLATGRSLAEIPVTVRWVTNQYDREGIGATLRPVATRVGATLEALSRMLPDDPAHSEMINGGTGESTFAAPVGVA